MRSAAIFLLQRRASARPPFEGGLGGVEFSSLLGQVLQGISDFAGKQ